jgi:hypothetical protein
MNMLSLLKDCGGDKAKIPLRLINYLTSQVHYGGKITNYEDNRIAQELLSTFLSEEILDKDPIYNLTGEQVITEQIKPYDMPTFGSVFHYTQHCQ